MAENMEELKNTEIDDDELENISGGNFSPEEKKKVLLSLYNIQFGNYTGGDNIFNDYIRATNIWNEMDNDKKHSYTAEDFKSRLKKDLGIEF